MVCGKGELPRCHSAHLAFGYVPVRHQQRVHAGFQRVFEWVSFCLTQEGLTALFEQHALLEALLVRHTCVLGFVRKLLMGWVGMRHMRTDIAGLCGCA